jgi:hypothetical protein
MHTNSGFFADARRGPGLSRVASTTERLYSCRLPLSTTTLNHVADLLRAHLKAIGSRWQSLPAGRIALLVLAVLRHDQRAADLAGGNDISATTTRRWTNEVIGLLAVRAPRLDRALRKIAKRGGEVVLIDGTLIPTRRRTGKANRPNYSGKHHRHGLHFLALTDERGRLIWISAARPGRTHDATAARHDHIVAHLQAAGLGALADLGFLGVDKPADPDDLVIVTGYKATRYRKLTTGQKTANKVIAAGRAPVEHGFAHLKNWRVLTKLRHRPSPRHQPAASPARPHQPRSQPVTDDQGHRPARTTSTNTSEPCHASTLTSYFRMATPQGFSGQAITRSVTGTFARALLMLGFRRFRRPDAAMRRGSVLLGPGVLDSADIGLGGSDRGGG